MKTLDMRNLTQALIEKGYPSARYEMTGGGCGTITIQLDNNYVLSVGPSDYATGEAREDELNWGVAVEDEDGDDEPTGYDAYFDVDEHGDFTVENIAKAIDEWQVM